MQDEDVKQFDIILTYMPEIIGPFAGNYVLVRKVKAGLGNKDFS